MHESGDWLPSGCKRGPSLGQPDPEFKSGKSLAELAHANFHCGADNQLSKFEAVFRKVMSVSKAEVLKREAREKQRNARTKARKRRR